MKYALTRAGRQYIKSRIAYSRKKVGKNKTSSAILITIAFLMIASAGCETEQRNPAYAGSYVLDKDYYVATLELNMDGSFVYEKQWTEEEHPMVRNAYRGKVEKESGEWISRPDRTDRGREVILLNPVPDNIIRLVVTEDGDLDEFTSNDLYRKK